jgi:hypothetical protein
MTFDGSKIALAAPAGGGPTLEAVASGALANGDMVSVNSDGTVSVVQGSDAYSTSTAVTFGNLASFDATNPFKAAYDIAQGKVVLVTSNYTTSRYGTAIVGTVSGTSISFGTPVTFTTASFQEAEIIYEPASGKMVVIGYMAGDNGKAIIGTVSGTSISFGSLVTYDTGLKNNSTGFSSLCIGASNKIFIAYAKNVGGNHTGNAIIGTISGTSISFGSTAIFSSANSQGVDYLSCAYDTVQDKHLITYQDDFFSNYGTAIVATVSGTSVSFGTKTVFHTSAVTGTEVMYHPPSQKMLIVYYQSGLYAKAATISGTSVSFGAQLDLGGSSGLLGKNIAGFVNDRCYFSYGSSAPNYYGLNLALGVTGTTVTILDGGSYQFAPNNVLGAIVYDTGNNKIVNFNLDATPNPDIGYAYVTTPIYTTATNYIGVSDGAYSNAATATVQIVGSVDDAQSGLTVGAQYVQADGSLSSSAGDPVVFAGTAVSSTKLIVKG